MKELFKILKDLVCSNWWLKLSAILLALLLWLLAGEFEAARTVTTPQVGHAQLFETKMNIHLQGDDIFSSPTQVQVRVELGLLCR